ncbi:MAG: bacterioferritin [Pseudomonadaceae bacterium]|nr:bacterioferritin [Pseudomonadaceae bacterium]
MTRANTEFKSDIKSIRKHARQHVEAGAVTEGYKADRKAVVDMLNGALATELVCALRYKYHYFTAVGIHAQAAAEEFLEHAEQEQEHADALAARIVQLGGDPDFSPEGLKKRSHSEYAVATKLPDMIKENLIAERVAIDTYREMVAFLGDDDPTTRRMLEHILAVEEEHADDLAGLLASDQTNKR